MSIKFRADCFGQVLQRHREWARATNRVMRADGYFDDYRDNLFRPLSEGSRKAYLSGRGNELAPQKSAPAKMAATYSSAALVVNVFDYWLNRPFTPLEEALALRSPIASLELERPFPTGLGGGPPHLDVAIWLKSGELIGVESKFTEWFQLRLDQGKFPESYGNGARWAEAGLPRCADLVAKMCRDEVEFLYLGAAQLLKHALGLAKTQANFQIFYLYYDCSLLSKVHQEEIDRFTALVGGEVGFTVCTYQSLLVRLKCAAQGHGEYLDYLEARYG